jgi:hypothetical protein
MSLIATDRHRSNTDDFEQRNTPVLGAKSVSAGATIFEFVEAKSAPNKGGQQGAESLANPPLLSNGSPLPIHGCHPRLRKGDAAGGLF